jgi:hypothetical protein
MARRFELIDLELVGLVDTVDSEFFATLRTPIGTDRPPRSAATGDEAARLARLLASRSTERAPDVAELAAMPRPLPERIYRRARRTAGRVRRRLRKR